MKPKFFLALFVLPGFLQTANAQLEQVWKTDYQITSDTFNTFGYKTDSAGNFYLYGWQHNRVFLQKHDPNGNIEWTVNDNSIVDSLTLGGYRYAVSNTRITDVVIDENSYIYITGVSSHKVLINPNYEAYFFISKLKNDGTLLWKQNYSERSDSFGFTMWNPDIRMVFSFNHLYLSYKHINIPVFCNGWRNYNFGLVKFDTSGTIVWNRVTTGDSAFCTRDIGTSLFVIDTLICFSGFSNSPTTLNLSKIFTFNFDTNGNIVDQAEEKQFILDPYSDQAYNLYLTDTFTTYGQAKGTTTYHTSETADSIERGKRNLMVLKYDQSLNRIWRYDLQKDTAVNISVKISQIDDSCNLLVSAIWKENGENKVLFLKLDSTGQEAFRDTFATGVEAAYCVINKNGQYVVPSSSWNGSSYATSVRKYTPSGELILDSTLIVPGKVIHGWVDSAYIYLVLVNGQTLSYLKFKDKDLSVGIRPIKRIQPAVYPNPVADVLHIVTPQTNVQVYSYRIFSLTGSLIAAGTASSEITVTALIPGMYILILTDSEQSVSATKFIKQ